jgi:hypothetical protein
VILSNVQDVKSIAKGLTKKARGSDVIFATRTKLFLISVGIVKKHGKVVTLQQLVVIVTRMFYLKQ